MIRISIPGFPRIGEKRELKSAVEKYFSGQSSWEQLKTNCSKIRCNNLLFLKSKGLSFIPADFSYYDAMLDLAWMFNAVPKRFHTSHLSGIDRYFAMARGFQNDKIDLKPLEMKKWFNSNYHYIVPELDGSCELKLTGNKPGKEFIEAMSLGISAKPVIIGPFTFLKLSRYTGEKSLADYTEDMVRVYADLFERLDELKIEFLQIDEPCLACDIEKNDIELFIRIYSKLLPRRRKMQICLGTCYGDISEIYSIAMSLDFSAYGLDFVDSPETVNLVEIRGFPPKKLLFAGIIDGKNIWINDYKKSLGLLRRLKKIVDPGNLVISASCTLAHVPHSLLHENEIPETVRSRLAFAEKKCDELAEIAFLFSRFDYENHELFINNQKLISEIFSRPKSHPVNSLEKVQRSSDRLTRRSIQKDYYKLPMLPSTTIGSFPQNPEIRKLRSDLRQGKINTETYNEKIKQYIKNCIELQESLGLDVLVHGEFERNDMVEFFAEQLEGFIITRNGWVQSYGTRCVKPPVIFSDIRRKQSITVAWTRYAADCTSLPVKGMLTGPVTMINWSFCREDISREQISGQLAAVLQQEIADLENAGIHIIQIDEAALREKLPLKKRQQQEYLDWAVNSFRTACRYAAPTTQIHTHMCYSDFSDIMNAISELDADVISIEAARSGFRLLESIPGTYNGQIGPGVYDIHATRIPSVEEITDALKTLLQKIPAELLWVNPDCGLKTRKESEIIPALKNMVEAAKMLRTKIS